MPMITLRYVTPAANSDLRAEVAALVSHLAAEHLRKDPAVTALLVEPADPTSWFVAGKHPADDGLSGFWLDIKITAGTNTKAQTSAFIRHAFEGMERLLGPLHPESYVLVDAVDGDAYGYGGRTQNARWAEANPG